MADLEVEDFFVKNIKSSNFGFVEEPEISVSLVYKVKTDNAQYFTKEEEKEIVKKIVLPTNKTLTYTIKKGDTLDIIAKKFGVKKSQILAFNNIKNENIIIAGKKILIPAANVKIQAKIKEERIVFQPKFVSALSNIGNILVPVSGLNQRRIHSNNGVDISAECGSPVYSADSGIVTESYDGWNGGYGNYIVIQHKNYETLYGHLSQRYVNIGDYVDKGTLIGTVGATGKATGCHLHFETRGIKNPLAY